MSNKITEATVYGDEPLWEGCESWDKEKLDKTFMQAIQWYNYMSDDRDHKKWLLDYCKQHKMEKSDIEKISKLDTVSIKYGEIPGEIGFDIGIYARILSLGGKINESLIADFEKYLKFLISKGNKTVSSTETNVKHVSIKERSIAKSYDVNNDIEKLGDEILSSGKEFKEETIKNIVSSRSLKQSQAANIIPVWQTKKSSFNAEDYEIAYTKENISKYLKFIDYTIKILTQVSEEKRVIIRKRRTKPATDQVKKMQYMKEDSTLKITSILPSKIVGASKVILFNTKYRKITILEAGNSVGFTVKGTTIYGFDDTKSYTKTITKNIDSTLKDLQTKGIRSAKTILDAIKSKKKPAKGKTNEFTLIVGVY